MVVSTRIVLSLLGVLGAIQAGVSYDFLDRYSASYAYPAFGVIVFLAFAVGWMVGGLVGQGTGTRIQEGRASRADPQCGRAHRGRDRPPGRPSGLGAPVVSGAHAAVHRNLDHPAAVPRGWLPVRLGRSEEAPRHPPTRRHPSADRPRDARIRSLAGRDARRHERDHRRPDRRHRAHRVPARRAGGAGVRAARAPAGRRLRRSAEARAWPPRPRGGAGPPAPR